MKRLMIIGILAILPALTYAQGNGDNAPGKQKGLGQSAKQFAPSQEKGEGQSAKQFAPGQENKSQPPARESKEGKHNKSKKQGY